MRAVAFRRVAALAGVEVRRSGELAGVAVAVAIGAMLKLELVQRVFALGNMALIAARLACPPCSGYALAAWSFTVNVEGFHPFDGVA